MGKMGLKKRGGFSKIVPFLSDFSPISYPISDQHFPKCTFGNFSQFPLFSIFPHFPPFPLTSCYFPPFFHFAIFQAPADGRLIQLRTRKPVRLWQGKGGWPRGRGFSVPGCQWVGFCAVCHFAAILQWCGNFSGVGH